MSKQKTEKQVLFQNAVREKLRSLIAPGIFLAVIGIVVLIFSLVKPAEKEAVIIKVHRHEESNGPEEYVLENDKVKMTLNAKTTQFTLLMKETGEVWYSNPPKADEDANALPAQIDKFNSTLLLTYSNKNGNDTTQNNYRYSVALENYEIEADKDHIKVLYSIGQVEPEYVVPYVTTEERMEELFAKIEENSPEDLQRCKDYYKKYDLNKLGAKDDAEQLKNDYPIIEDGPIYVLREVSNNIKADLEGFFADAGFTNQEYLDQVEQFNIQTASSKPVFNVNMIYTLEGSDLIVEVPFDEMEFKDTYPVTTLQVLPYFGAGSTLENGSLLVPEGGGSLIHFNNKKTTHNEYFANLYGWDWASGPKDSSMVHETRSYFGVFGIAKDDNSFICMIEDGAAYAGVRADISERMGLGSYNYVAAEYKLLHREEVSVGSRTTGRMFYYELNLPKEKIRQRYRFIPSDNYVDMANAYHDYLEEKYPDSFVKNTDTDVPVAVEIVGAVDKTKQILGVPVSKPLVVTTYKEAQEILKDINDKGVKNVSVKLSGWTNGGVNQKLLKKVKLVSGLGGKKNLNALTKYASDNGMDMYLNGVTCFAYDSDFRDGFLSFRDAASFANKKRTQLYEYDTVYFGENHKKDPFYLIKPALTVEMMKKLSGAAKTYKASGVAFADSGYKLSADYNRKHHVSRQEALNMQLEEMLEIKKSGQKIMTNMGNDYTLSVTDFITNMDLGGSNYSLLDEQIPFYQIAIHGYVNYAGEPINLTQNYQDELLKSVEYGAGLSFTFMDAEITELQDTYYSHYFGANYDGWKDSFAEIYERYEKELGGLFAQRIKGHENLKDQVALTTYEDGTKVYVNYGYTDAKTQDGVSVPARDYVVVR